ncbi:MAG: hypothetical protein NTV51_12825 [Verrucomicrobia bacterium]|nr:hypothetical protein [Verrucomicrobiota bacterium]
MKRLAILATVIAIALGVGCSVGLRRYPASIEASLAELTPLGSNPDTVLEAVKKKGWRTTGYNERSGFYKQQGAKHETVGVSHIQASLGDYYALPLGTTNATAFWGFDKDKRLIQVWVWKTTDSI